MVIATLNKSKRLLFLSYLRRVRVEDIRRGRDDVTTLLADLPAGFRILADLGGLDSMDAACAVEIGKIMEMCDHRGVERVVRLIPDPKKDIGLNILSLFHYRPGLPVVTCKSLAEAAAKLSL